MTKVTIRTGNHRLALVDSCRAMGFSDEQVGWETTSAIDNLRNLYRIMDILDGPMVGPEPGDEPLLRIAKRACYALIAEMLFELNAENDERRRLLNA